MLSFSILACINPEAVVPGLNYVSFANVSMCGLTPNVVDLSMEANAIALKYLSENQLSRLSLSHSGQNPPVDFSFQDVLPTNMDKSMVGLSLISPNNMSFATKKYMKRYGLIQGNDSSEDEEELQVQDGSSGTVKSESMLDRNCTPVSDGFNHWTELTERIEGRLPFHVKNHSRELTTTNASPPELNSPVLRNITNEIFPPRADQAEENSVQVLKDLKSKMKLLPGRVEFTEQPGRKDEGDIQMFPGNLHTPALETLNQSNSINSVGTILDVKQLRQLPKLFWTSPEMAGNHYFDSERDPSVKYYKEPRIKLSLKRSLCFSNIKLSFQPRLGTGPPKCLVESMLSSTEVRVHFCLQLGVILKYLKGESTWAQDLL